ncbi:MAG: GIY-YIG nuclease family protein [Flavobacteriales bacterium]|nr:GIY-YIG nuclease family protein [Flavobacteriales bacterium]
MLFAITDIETTGSHASGNSIIEIGVVLFDGEKIIREFETLLDPGIRLPHFITSLTGITDDMLEPAPTFSQVADELEEIFENAVFVAHNVNFDYSFIKAEFNAMGRNFQMPRVCTMRVARKAFPGAPSYGLNNLCNWLGVTNESAHRALSDARAAHEIFQKSLSIIGDDVVHKMIGRASGDVFLPPNLDKKEFAALPEKPGVYYLLNEKGKPIYIGKAKNLRKRVKQHFTTNTDSKRNQAFMKEIFHVSFELTGTELIALLLEDAEIRKYWPAYNSAQKRRTPRVHVVRYYDQQGYDRLAIQESNKIIGAHKTFPSHYTARNWLMEISKEFDIDMRLLGLTMFDVHRELPLPDNHNKVMIEALRVLEKREPSYILQGEGRSDDEISAIVVRNGQLKGFAFVSMDLCSVEDIESALLILPPTEVNASIIATISSEHHGYIRIDDLQQANQYE